MEFRIRPVRPDDAEALTGILVSQRHDWAQPGRSHESPSRKPVVAKHFQVVNVCLEQDPGRAMWELNTVRSARKERLAKQAVGHCWQDTCQSE